MMKNKRYKVSLHLIGWFFFVFFKFILVNGANLEFDIATQFISLIIYAVVFYGFYFLITPLLFKKKIIFFIIVSVIYISGAIKANYEVQKQIHEKRFKEIVKRKIDISKVDIILLKELGVHDSIVPQGKTNFKIMITSLQVMFFVVVSLLLSLAQKLRHDEKARYVLEKEKSDAELHFLKQQINPHFIFNSLNSIYSLANKKSDLTAEAILKLSALFRYILYHSEKDMVPLGDELTTVEDYIELQRLRITDKMKLTYEVHGNPDEYFIAPLLLIPILENAFKYGIDSISDSFIFIVIKIKDGIFSLDVSNKIVPQKFKIDEESGIGLKNIRRRLELLYPDNFKLDINEEEHIFKVILTLVLKK